MTQRAEQAVQFNFGKNYRPFQRCCGFFKKHRETILLQFCKEIAIITSAYHPTDYAKFQIQGMNLNKKPPFC
jgi:hypothetical protein